jgi:molybdate transport system substrate-binding protein
MSFKSRLLTTTSSPLAFTQAQWDDRGPSIRTRKAMAEIKVLSSIATKEAYLELVPQFETLSGHKVATTWAGTTAIMQRMTAGERYDLVIISSSELDELSRQGKIVSGSRVDLAKSGIGVAVRSGAPKPDIGSAEALKRALLAAKTVGYTSGPSGVYMGGLIERMGIANEVKAKFRSVPSGGTIGTIVASGDCEIGFQQVSELVHIPGIDYIGPLPADVQRVTVFSCGLQSGAPEPNAAKALVAFLTTPAAVAVMQKHGLEAA